MLYFTRFNPIHLRRFEGVQSEQAEEALFAVSMPEAAAVAQHEAWTGWIGSDVVGCAGFIPTWSNRAMVWALIGTRCGPHMLAITRFVRAKMTERPETRIEATVLTGFARGERWATMLGFTCETPDGMKNYGPDGATYSLYSWCRT
jgi:hypothetical protein